MKHLGGIIFLSLCLISGFGGFTIIYLNMEVSCTAILDRYGATGQGIQTRWEQWNGGPCYFDTVGYPQA